MAKGFPKDILPRHPFSPLTVCQNVNFAVNPFHHGVVFKPTLSGGCKVLYSGPCAVEPYTELGTQAYMTGTALAAGELAVRGSNMLPESELGNLRRAPFGPALCQILETRDWDRLEALPEACHYLAKRCILWWTALQSSAGAECTLPHHAWTVLGRCPTTCSVHVQHVGH